MQKRSVVVCVRPARWQKRPFPAYCMAFNSGGAGVCLLTCLLTLRFRWQTDSPEMPWRYINPSSRPRSNMLWHSPVRRLEPSRTIPAWHRKRIPGVNGQAVLALCLFFFFSSSRATVLTSAILDWHIRGRGGGDGTAVLFSFSPFSIHLLRFLPLLNVTK